MFLPRGFLLPKTRARCSVRVAGHALKRKEDDIMRYENPAQAINFLAAHSSGRLNRHSGVLSIEKPSLRCLGAVSYLRAIDAKGIRVFRGKVEIVNPSRFLNMVQAVGVATGVANV